jgi:hypothetical protein
MHKLLAALALTLSLAQAQSTHFINGQWFDGHGFKRTHFYSVNGTLTHTKPASIDQTVDLNNAFVIPPFGDGYAFPGGSSRYVEDGVFYAMTLSGPSAATNSPGVELAIGRAAAAPTPARPAILSTPASSDAAQLTELARRAYADKLRLAIHAGSLASYRAAVAANADIIAGLPDDPLTKADARETARRRILVLPTAASPANLRMLKSARVELGIGAGGASSTALESALALRSTGVFSNLELLKMFSEVTPRAIFPTRKIGYLAEGYEASFLVLAQNPLKDFAAVQTITSRYKQGRIIPLV